MLPKEDGQGQDGDKKAKPVPRTCYLKKTARARVVTRRPSILDARKPIPKEDGQGLEVDK